LTLGSSACEATSPTQNIQETETVTQFVLPPENTVTPSSPPSEKSELPINATPTITTNVPNSIVATSIIEASTPGNTQVHPSGSQCNNALFIDDVTIPDGTIMAPGKEFMKTWKIKNIGTCQWTTAYGIDFAYGNKLDGDATKLQKPVDPGNIVDISVAMTAPEDNGWYSGWWRLKSEAGNYFGDFVYVSIQITEGREVTTP
jgi:hypothetical protein